MRGPEPELTYLPAGACGRTSFRARRKRARSRTPPAPPRSGNFPTDDLTRLIVFRNVAIPTLIENSDNAKMVATSFILDGQGPRANGRDKICQSISPLRSPVIGSALDPYQVLASALLSSPALVRFTFPMMGSPPTTAPGMDPNTPTSAWGEPLLASVSILSREDG